MKKLTVLFTLLCTASALNGMKPERGRYVGMGDLPPEVQAIIVSYLHTYDNLNDIVKAIKATSETNRQLKEIVNEEYGDPKKFKALVHVLANKFNTATKNIAEQLGTPFTTKHYTLAGDTLIQAIKNGSIHDVTKAIALGADVNYSFDHGEDKLTPLLLAVTNEKYEIIKLLLDNGANPHFIGGHDIMTGRGLKAIDYLYMKQGDPQQKKKIKALLEK